MGACVYGKEDRNRTARSLPVQAPSMSRKHQWERSLSAWEAELPRRDDGGSNEELEDYDNISQCEAAIQLFNYVVDLKLDGKVNATQACILSFWACRSGATGLIEKLGRPPGKQSGSYSSHFDSIVLPKDDDIHKSLCSVSVPGHRRSDATRCVTNVDVLYPLDLIATEFYLDPAKAKADVAMALAEDRLPSSYLLHPVVAGADESEVVLPYGRYLDKVPFQRTDSCLGWWLYNVLSGTRHLIAVLRASEMCKCGCRGHCSLYPMWSFFSWAFGALARGVHPEGRHDKKPFRKGEMYINMQANKPLGFKVAVIFVKMDMGEYPTLGLASCASKSPCPLCWCTKQDWTSDDWQDANAFDEIFQWQSKTRGDYETACNACETNVLVGNTIVHVLRGRLFFDKRKDGSLGRSLRSHVPGLGLRRYDRMEPTPSRQDVAELDASECPVQLTFWRRGHESWVRRRNPAFSTSTGLSLELSLVPDWMH